jgi:hypothetical protein
MNRTRRIIGLPDPSGTYIWLFALLVGVSLGAKPATALTPEDDACHLLSPDEVSKVLGVAVDPGVHPLGADHRLCYWREPGKDGVPARGVNLTLLDAGSFETGKHHSSRTAVVPENGIGDEAYYVRALRLPISLVVRKGDLYIRVMARTTEGAGSARGIPDPEIEEANRTADLAIAKRVLEKRGS